MARLVAFGLLAPNLRVGASFLAVTRLSGPDEVLRLRTFQGSITRVISAGLFEVRFIGPLLHS